MNNKLVIDYLPLANKLAYKKKRMLPPFIDIDELKSAAYMGLVEAASRFDETRGVSFSTFAYPRIFGAIQDYLRETGWNKKNGSKMLSLETNEGDGSLGDMLEAKEEKDCTDFFETVSLKLDNQAKNILRYYFVDDLSMKEVGDKLHVSESRISQLIKSYKEQIRTNWEESALREFAA